MRGPVLFAVALILGTLVGAVALSPPTQPPVRDARPVARPSAAEHVEPAAVDEARPQEFRFDGRLGASACLDPCPVPQMGARDTQDFAIGQAARVAEVDLRLRWASQTAQAAPDLRMRLLLCVDGGCTAIAEDAGPSPLELRAASFSRDGQLVIEVSRATSGAGPVTASGGSEQPFEGVGTLIAR